MTSRQAIWIWKPSASTAFLVFAWRMGAFESPYGRAIFTGLCLSWLGDILLIPESSKAFLAGLGSFLAAHIAYSCAFLLRWKGFESVSGMAAAPILGTLLVARWLLPHLENRPRFKVPVIAYMVAITFMVVCAGGAALASGDARILVGAVLFYLSDISVARDKFVAPGEINRAWGLPLYYAAQFVLASTVA